MAKGIIASREERAKFDQAVKDVIKQRRATQQLQTAARQHKQLSKNGGPSNAQQVAQMKENRAKLAALVRTPEFAKLSTNGSSINSGQQSSSQSRRKSNNFTSSITSSNKFVNSEGLQNLREQHPRDQHRESYRRTGSDRSRGRRATISLDSRPVGIGNVNVLSSSPPSSPKRYSAPDIAIAANKGNIQSRYPSDNTVIAPSSSRRRFTLDRSASFNVLEKDTIHKGMKKLPQASSNLPRIVSGGDLYYQNKNNPLVSVSTYKPKSSSRGGNDEWEHKKSPIRHKPSTPTGGSEGEEILLPQNMGDGLDFSMMISSSESSRRSTSNIASRLANINLDELVPTRRKSQDHITPPKKIEQLRRSRNNSKGDGEWGNNNQGAVAESSSTGDEEYNKFLSLLNDVGEPNTATDGATTASQQRKTLTPSSSGRSYYTANSREGGITPVEVVEQEQDDIKDHRSQLILTKGKPQSGATGPTTGTSASSLLSSNSSGHPINNSSGNNSPGFEAIKEEGKDTLVSEAVLGDSTRRELLSGDSFEYNDMPGFSTYKNRRSSRIKKIKKSIAMTLLGTSSSSNIDGESQGGTTISADKQERLSRHLMRKSSARSMNSAHTSGDLTTSSQKSTASSRWSRFRRKGKSHSMSNMQPAAVGGARGSDSRHVLIANQRMSRRSNSDRSNISNISNDDSHSSSFSAKLVDFYDNSDHANAVSSLIAAKSASGRSLVSTLEMIKEPLQEGEQKHDEDYHSIRDARRDSAGEEQSAYHRYMDNSAHCSDESVDSFYEHPLHEHPLVHIRPNQIFPDSPGWQCDKCCQETLDLNIWAYISTEKNYCLCEDCFSKKR